MSMSKTDLWGMVALNGATEQTITLDPRYAYQIIHTGANVSGTATANEQLSAWLSTVSSTITCDKSVQDHKFELIYGTSQQFGPGIVNLYVKSTANADGVLKIVRIGTPSNSY